MRFRSPIVAPLVAIGVLLSLSACGSSRDANQTAEPDARSFAILSINDLYRAEGFVETDEAGLSRVRALREELEQDNEVLLLHAGDFLYPSLLSREYHGKQMISVMNLLDGGPEFDERMFVTFGNHEFEKGGWKDLGALKARVDESDFDWIVSNVEFPEKPDNKPPKLESDRLLTSRILTINGIKVGLYGLTMPADVEYAEIRGSDQELVDESVRMINALRAEGADVVIALTHLPLRKDVAVLNAQSLPDILIGGHDHSRIDSTVNGRWLLKADADGRGAWEIRVELDDTGKPKFEKHYHKLEKTEKDELVQSVADIWEFTHEHLLCDKRGLDDTCLDDKFAIAGDVILAEEVTIRSQSTNLGNYITDQMVANARRVDGARFEDAVAFVNSGSIRLNRNIGKGEAVTRRAIEEILEYGSSLYYRLIPGDSLKMALDYSVACRESGPWLQVSDGIGFGANLEDGKAENVTINSSPLDESASYLVITNDWLAGEVTAKPDGYTTLGKEGQWIKVDPNDTTRSGMRNAICAGLNECEDEDPPTTNMDSTPRVRLPADAELNGGASAACSS